MISHSSRDDRPRGEPGSGISPTPVVRLATAAGETVGWGETRDRRHPLAAPVARVHDENPDRPPLRSTAGQAGSEPRASRPLQAITAAAAVAVLAAVIVLIVLELGRDAGDGLRIADADRIEVIEPAPSSPFIAVEPSRFSELQVPAVGQPAAPAPSQDAGPVAAPMAKAPAKTAAAVVSPGTPSVATPPAVSSSAATPAVTTPADEALVTDAGVTLDVPAPPPAAGVPPSDPRSGERGAGPVQAPAQPAPRSTVGLELLMDRGNGLLARSDVSAARLFFRLAAQQGHAAGAMAMAATYDPLTLAGPQMRGVRPDARAAVEWYRRAAALGDRSADERAARVVEHLDRRAAEGDAEARAALRALGR